MTSTLVDSNILIDIFQPNSNWFTWSRHRLREARLDGPLILNFVIASEVASEFMSEKGFDAKLASSIFVREDVPWSAAFAAGVAYREYRLRGGKRDRLLPDFLIGAHALTKGHRLLTRDARRYRAYFPGLDIVAPDSHP